MNIKLSVFFGLVLFFTTNLALAQNKPEEKENETKRIAPVYYFVNNKITSEDQVRKILENPHKWIRKVKVMTGADFSKTYKLKIDGNALMIYTKGKGLDLQTAP